MAGANNKHRGLSNFQIMQFTSGNVMGDLILAVYQSYMLTFQTKVLRLPSNVVGLLWLVPSAIDAILALLLGYMSDNVTIPLMSKKYGQRKTWHLIGCIMFAVSFPFLLMRCFFCGANNSGWQVILYYIALLIINYIGWDLTQANFLALIPDIASTQSEMVKLGATSSAVTLICGVFVYVVTWVLFGKDASSTISTKQQPAFMILGLIIVGTGILFESFFHFGLREPGSEGVCRSIRCFLKSQTKARTAYPKMDDCHTSLLLMEAKVDEKQEKNEDNAKTLQETIPDEQDSQENGRKNDNDSLHSDDVFASEGMPINDCDNFELFMPKTFIDMVPVPNVILSSRHNSGSSGIGQLMSGSRGPSGTASKIFQRSTSQIVDSRRNSKSYQGFRDSRRSSNMHQQFGDHRVISRHNSRETCPSVIQINSRTLPKDHDINVTQPSQVRLTPEITSEQYVINCIEEPVYPGIVLHYESKKESVLIKLLKNPDFYRLGCAYMFTRLAQNITNSYMPLFLTDWLKYPKIAIAYFPIVILISGVGASFGGKKLNTLLGNKWTFCLGSIMVMGASGWFYLLTPENRSVMYVPAIVTGCGTSIMFVTTLALAADFVDADRKSGAFLMASMGLLAKIFSGALFYFLQEFTPKQGKSNPCPECISYVHYVFSLGPGVSAFLGLWAFILFIPATIQCKPIVQMEDAETQTEELSFTNFMSVMNHNVMMGHDEVTMATRDASTFNVIEEEPELENKVIENSSHTSQEQESEMNPAL